LREFIEEDDIIILQFLQKVTNSIYDIKNETDILDCFQNCCQLFKKLHQKYSNKNITIKFHSIRELCIFFKYIGMPSNWLGFVYENLLSYARRKISPQSKTWNAMKIFWLNTTIHSLTKNIGIDLNIKKVLYNLMKGNKNNLEIENGIIGKFFLKFSIR
jgi:hypothetical protein